MKTPNSRRIKGISSDLTPPNRNGGRKGNQLNPLRKCFGGKNEKKNEQALRNYDYYMPYLPAALLACQGFLNYNAQM